MSDRPARVLYACLRRFIHGDSNNLALSTRKHAYALVVTYQILGVPPSNQHQPSWLDPARGQ